MRGLQTTDESLWHMESHKSEPPGSQAKLTTHLPPQCTKKHVAKTRDAREAACLCPKHAPTHHAPPSSRPRHAQSKRGNALGRTRTGLPEPASCFHSKHTSIPSLTGEMHECGKDLGCTRTRLLVPAACSHSPHTSLLPSATCTKQAWQLIGLREDWLA